MAAMIAMLAQIGPKWNSGTIVKKWWCGPFADTFMLRRQLSGSPHFHMENGLLPLNRRIFFWNLNSLVKRNIFENVSWSTVFVTSPFSSPNQRSNSEQDIFDRPQPTQCSKDKFWMSLSRLIWRSRTEYRCKYLLKYKPRDPLNTGIPGLLKGSFI